MTNLWRNIRFGIRLLWKNAGFSSLAVLALALGIGATTAIFSVIYGALLAHLPYRDPERLVSVWSQHEGNQRYVSPSDYLDWKRESTVFDGLGALVFDRVTVADESGIPEVVRITRCTPGLFNTLGIPLLFGRDFLPEEAVQGKDHVAILSYALWRDGFASDRNVLGRKVRIDRQPYTIVGVHALTVREGQRNADTLTVPLTFKPEEINRESHYLMVQGRLKSGVTLPQAEAEMQTIGRRVAQANPATNKGWDVFVERREHEWVAPELRSKLFLLMGAVGFVLLIACANVANLLLARGAVRQREVAVRRSLGATKGQLFAQFLTESMMLALIGGACGVATAWGLLKITMALMPPDQLPTEADIGLQLPVLLFALAVATISAVVCGSAPALQSMRVDLMETLKDGTRSTIGMGGRGFRRLLVVGEFAMALTLLTGAGLAIHGFGRAASVDLGFRTDHILTFSLQMQPQINQGRFATQGQINAFFRQLLLTIEAIPGVTVADASTAVPAMGAAYRLPVTIAGKSPSDSSSVPQSNYGTVTPGFFKTFGVEMDRGRPLDERDTEADVRVAVVNQAFVKRFLSGIEPLDQRILVPEVTNGARKPGAPIEWQIVGVYRNVRNDGLNEPQPEIDVPFWQNPFSYPLIAVRASADPETIRKSIAAAIQSIDPDIAMVQVETMDDVVRDFSAGERFGAVLFGSFGAVGLILAGLGIYGVMAFAVAQRTREIGLRIALGAGRERILRLFIGEGVALGGVGLVIGIAGAYTVTRLMRGIWYGIQGPDPIAFGAAAIVLLSFALLACYIPARRAAKLDPMVALRYE